jgi:hypothetical protein
MKKKILIVIMMVALFLAPLNIHSGGLPVVDWSALIQRVTQVAKTLAQWYQYIEKFKKFNNDFKRYKYAFMTTYRGFENLDSLSDIFVNVDNLEHFIEMVYHDSGKYDTWADIFSEAKTIEAKYQGINDDQYLRDNPLYKNPNIKPEIDRVIEKNKNKLIEINGGIEMAKNYRKTEEEILGKIKKYQDKVGIYATEGGETKDTTKSSEIIKMLYINALTSLENLRVETELTSLMRLKYEKLLKDEIELLDEENHEGKRREEEIKNYETLKSGK